MALSNPEGMAALFRVGDFLVRRDPVPGGALNLVRVDGYEASFHELLVKDPAGNEGLIGLHNILQYQPMTRSDAREAWTAAAVAARVEGTRRG